jgi:hypothetical protein
MRFAASRFSMNHESCGAMSSADLFDSPQALLEDLMVDAWDISLLIVPGTGDNGLSERIHARCLIEWSRQSS